MVGLDLDNGQLHIWVGDHSRALPERPPQPPTATTGRGLVILDALCDGWGIELLDDGVVRKAVLAALHAQPKERFG